MIKFIILGAVLGWLTYHIEKRGVDRVALIATFIEIGLFFKCIGLI